MDLNLRKFAKFVDKTFIEGGKKAKTPVLLVSVAAVIKNPWIGKGFVENLKPEILALAPKLGDILVPELIKEIGSGEKIIAYGKAAVVGLKGEIEHASAFIHTVRVGNKFRNAVGGTSYLSFTNTRGPAGCKISGFKSSTKPLSIHGFFIIAATETSKTGVFAFLPPSIKVLSTNFAIFLKFKSILTSFSNLRFF